MAYSVYWIHLPEHSDPHTEGYVGITMNDPSTRFFRHIRENDQIREAVSLGVVQSLLSEGLTESEARVVEREYRPEANIGWNKAKGGGSGMSHPGYRHPPEAFEAASKRRKKQYANDPELRERLRRNLEKGRNRSPPREERDRISQALMGHEVSFETRQKIKNKPKQECPSCGGMFHPCGMTKHRRSCA